jgi:hypothetical protein
VCVRYLYDKDKQRRLKTIELVVEEVEWQPRDRRPRRCPHDLVGVGIAYHEHSVRQAVKAAGGIWRPRQRLWEVSWRPWAHWSSRTASSTRLRGPERAHLPG